MPKDMSSDARIEVTAGKPVELPNGQFIADAAMTRDGMDLHLTSPDGHTIIVEGYFAQDPAPDLLTPDGGRLSPQLVDSFLPPERTGQYAASGQTATDESPAGKITEVVGEAHIIRADGTKVEAKVGTPVYQGDVIETSKTGAVNMLFADNTTFAVSESARLSVDQFVYNSAEQSGSTFFSMLQGVFIYTSGLIGKADPGSVSIETPVGSIGIRGTVVAGHIMPAGQDSQITILDGAVTLTNSTGTQEMNTSFQTVSLSSYQDQPETTQMDAQSFSAAYGSVSNVAGDTFTHFSNAAPADGSEAPANDAAPAPSDGGNTTAPAPDGDAAPATDGGTTTAPDDGAAATTPSLQMNDAETVPPPPPPTSGFGDSSTATFTTTATTDSGTFAATSTSGGSGSSTPTTSTQTTNKTDVSVTNSLSLAQEAAQEAAFAAADAQNAADAAATLHTDAQALANAAAAEAVNAQAAATAAAADSATDPINAAAAQTAANNAAAAAAAAQTAANQAAVNAANAATAAAAAQAAADQAAAAATSNTTAAQIAAETAAQTAATQAAAAQTAESAASVNHAAALAAENDASNYAIAAADAAAMVAAAVDAAVADAAVTAAASSLALAQTASDNADAYAVAARAAADNAATLAVSARAAADAAALDSSADPVAAAAADTAATNAETAATDADNNATIAEAQALLANDALATATQYYNDALTAQAALDGAAAQAAALIVAGAATDAQAAEALALVAKGAAITADTDATTYSLTAQDEANTVAVAVAVADAVAAQVDAQTAHDAAQTHSTDAGNAATNALAEATIARTAANNAAATLDPVNDAADIAAADAAATAAEAARDLAQSEANDAASQLALAVIALAAANQAVTDATTAQGISDLTAATAAATAAASAAADAQAAEAAAALDLAAAQAAELDAISNADLAETFRVAFAFSGEYTRLTLPTTDDGVREFASVGTPIGTAAPLNAAGTVTYSMVVNGPVYHIIPDSNSMVGVYNGTNIVTVADPNSIFAINSSTGEITVADPLAFSSVANPTGFSITITATDSVLGADVTTRQILMPDYPGTPRVTNGSITNGTAADDILVTTSNTVANLIGGNGGQDVLLDLGTGNTLLGIGSAGFKLVDGGLGSDELKLYNTSTNFTVDFTNAGTGQVRNIETMNLGIFGGIGNHAILDAQAVYNMTTAANAHTLDVFANGTAVNSRLDVMGGLSLTAGFWGASPILEYTGTVNSETVTLRVHQLMNPNDSITSLGGIMVMDSAHTMPPTFGAGAPLISGGTNTPDYYIAAGGTTVLKGHGGADILIGGNSLDYITVGDAGFEFVDGGAGYDKLILGDNTDTNFLLDFRGLVEWKVRNIEALELGTSTTNTGNHAILTLQDVFDMTTPDGSNNHQLEVYATSGIVGSMIDVDTGGANNFLTQTVTAAPGTVTYTGTHIGGSTVTLVIYSGMNLAATTGAIQVTEI